MKRIVFTLVILLVTIIASLAQNSFRITHGPYLCDMDETGVTVVWTTNGRALSWVEIAPDDGSHFYGYERPKYFETKYGRAQVDSIHSIRINGLKPGTTYRYRIYSKEILNWQKNSDRILYGRTIATNVFRKAPLSFTTYNPDADTVSFLVLNDIHGRADIMEKLCSNVNLKSLNMVVFNGDMSSYINNSEQLFSDFIDVSVKLFASEIPIEFSRGNHETRGPFADHLMDFFPRKDGNFYQFFRVGAAAFLLLDCGEDKPDSDIEYGGIAFYDKYRKKETSWLKEVVNSESYCESSIQIAILHIPLTVGNWHGNIHLQNTMMQVLNRSGIDVMLSGHTHRYSFQKPEEGKAEFPVVVNSNNTALLCHVIKNRIHISIIDVDGKKIHEYWLE